MTYYETDEEKVEAIKKWWKENGFSVVAGVVIGLGAIFGWRAWIDYHDGLAQRASGVFEQLLVSANTADSESALARSGLLVEEFSSTVYATLATLVKARVQLEGGNLAEARIALEAVIAGSPDPGITRIAALRLVRVLVAEGDLGAAADVIAAHDNSESFSGAFAGLRGDIARAEGRTDDARAAYEQALAAGAPDPAQLRLKLEDLPPAG